MSKTELFMGIAQNSKIIHAHGSRLFRKKKLKEDLAIKNQSGNPI
jgi:hypothetical protein